MLHFKRLTLADKAVIQHYTLGGERRNCDLSFANLCGWQFLYDTEIAEFDGFLLFRFYADRHLAYMMPVGTGNLAEVVAEMMADARQQGHPFLMHGICAGTVEELEAAVPNTLHYICDRDYSDYIYAREDLATLRGKRLQGKRNHANRFWRNNAQAEYRALTPDLVPQCLAFADAWYAANIETGDDESTLEEERRALSFVLQHMAELDIVGGALFVGERMVAFTYGAAINQDTFDVCVEKADTTFEGSYAAINQAFVQHLPEQFRLINREEDLGVEGLRKAKLSYQPTLILEKFSAREKHPLEAASKPPAANPQEEADAERVKAETRTLWKMVFGDSDAFIDLYFSTKYRDDINVTLQVDGHVVSALQRLPYTLTYGHDELTAAYVSGVCTHPDYRNRGFMAALMGEAHRQMFDSATVLALLIPAEPSLFDLYARFGYINAFAEGLTTWTMPEKIAEYKDVTIENINLSTLQNEAEIFAYFSLQMRQRPCCVQHTAADFSVILADLRLADGQLWLARTAGKIAGMAIAAQRDNGLHVLELLTDEGVPSDALLQAIATKAGVISLTVHEANATAPQHALGQLRVINAYEALQHYAGLHPEVEMRIQVSGDREIAQNNGFFCLGHGKCERLSSAEVICPNSGNLEKETNVLNIGELAHFLFADMYPFMSLMLN